MIPERLLFLLEGAQRILLAGAGGGYDILGAVPLLEPLRRLGKTVFLASLSFTNSKQLGARPVEGVPILYGLTGEHATEAQFCPEAWLSRWLEGRGVIDDPTLWSMEPSGYHPIHDAYCHLIERLGIDTIVLVDGGVDLLLRGDETSLGTPAEDLASLAVVSRLDVPRKVAASIGFGVELRDGIQHAQVLERYAELTRAGAFLGQGSLVQGSRVGDQYLAALEYVLGHQPGLHQSHVHRMIRASMLGEFGPDGPHIWVSPLMSQFWFFDLPTVARTHLFLEHLTDSHELIEVVFMIKACRRDLVIRDRERIPI
jgi:hypothetical protein